MSSFPFENGSNSHLKAPRIAKRKGSNTKIAPSKDNALEGRLKLSVAKGDDWVEIMMPIITVSEANGGAKKSFKRNGKTCYKTEHWSEKSSRHKRQKGTVSLTLRPNCQHLRMPCQITLTRYAPRKLDRFDNLPMSLKYILDAICEIITNDFVPGRADSHEGLTVVYDQETNKEYGVKVHIKNT